MPPAATPPTGQGRGQCGRLGPLLLAAALPLVTAAEGAACAADQGLFWPMHDVLFLRQGQENRGVFSASNVKKFAREAAAGTPSVKFDAAAFDKCLDKKKFFPFLTPAEQEEARSNGDAD